MGDKRQRQREHAEELAAQAYAAIRAREDDGQLDLVDPPEDRPRDSQGTAKPR